MYLSALSRCARLTVCVLLSAFLPFTAMAVDYTVPGVPDLSGGNFTITASDTLTVNAGGAITNSDGDVMDNYGTGYNCAG